MIPLILSIKVGENSYGFLKGLLKTYGLDRFVGFDKSSEILETDLKKGA